MKIISRQQPNAIRQGVLWCKYCATKLRVVFDASMKSSNNISFNDLQLIGPVVQNDLLSILLRFRQYKYVLCGDIKMMYRQVLLENEHRIFQKIFWRENPTDELKVFQLNTVTYGTASAPYLATRCLKQLSIDCESFHPTASRVIANDFYVDDLITGCDSLSTLIDTKNAVCSILKSAGFELRKFMANNSQITDTINNPNDNLTVLTFSEHENCKTLGVTWNSNKDVIQFAIRSAESMIVKPTKRNILSIISAIFDPLGLVGPVIVSAKLIIQSMWESGLGWDETISVHLQTIWSELRQDLHLLNKLNIPRHVIACNMVRIELHGFSDASERAYGACLYLRTIDIDNRVTTNLLIAKSKVAPLTLPRLELCAAYLLTNVVKKVTIAMPTLQLSKSFLWTDSTITLHWIKSSPNRWKTFVANRVASIQENSDIADWHHVSSTNNPADIISQGATPHALINSQL